MRPNNSPSFKLRAPEPTGTTAMAGIPCTPLDKIQPNTTLISYSISEAPAFSALPSVMKPRPQPFCFGERSAAITLAGSYDFSVQEAYPARKM